MADLKLTDEVLSKVMLEGDLSKLTPKQKMDYYCYRCKLADLDPATKPFDLIKDKKTGKETLCANRSTSEQLRVKKKISITRLAKTREEGIYLVEAEGKDSDGRTDVATGVVSLTDYEGNLLTGRNLANALMTAETKAKNRVTLSLCGLSILDESEVTDNPEIFAKLPTIENAVDASPKQTPEPLKFPFAYDLHLVPEEARDRAKIHLEKHGAIASGVNGTWLSQSAIPHMDKYKRVEEAA